MLLAISKELLPEFPEILESDPDGSIYSQLRVVCSWCWSRDPSTRPQMSMLKAMLASLYPRFNAPSSLSLLAESKDSLQTLGANNSTWDAEKDSTINNNKLLNDIEECIRLCVERMREYPPSHQNHGQAARDLALALRRRFEVIKYEDDILESIRLYRDILSLRPAGHKYHDALLGLAIGLHYHCEITKSLDEIDEAIRLLRDVLVLRPSGHANRSDALCGLVRSLRYRYKLTRSRENIDESIRLSRDVLTLRPLGHKDHDDSLIGIALGLQSRYELTKSQDDLNESIRFFREAESLRPPGHKGRNDVLLKTAFALQYRFELTGSRGDLDECIHLRKVVLSFHIPGPGHEYRDDAMLGLAIGLQYRFKLTKSLDDIDESIRLFKDVLSLYPPGHEYRVGALEDVANAVSARFELTRLEVDISEVVRMFEGVVSVLDLSDREKRARALVNLAGALRKRNKLTHRRSDIVDAKRYEKEARQLPRRPKYSPHPRRTGKFSLWFQRKPQHIIDFKR